MAMSKKDFIELADTLRSFNKRHMIEEHFNEEHINALADFCKSQNSAFMRDRWMGYIHGECGSNGGKVKVAK